LPATPARGQIANGQTYLAHGTSMPGICKAAEPAMSHFPTRTMQPYHQFFQVFDNSTYIPISAWRKHQTLLDKN
jgi:hypothetical protein